MARILSSWLAAALLTWMVGVFVPTAGQAARPTVFPLFDGTGTSSADDMRRLVGSVRHELLNCQKPGYFNIIDDRSVRSVLDRVPDEGLLAHPAVASAVLLDAARFAWRTCPQPYVWVDGKPEGDFHYDVGSIEINGPNGERVLSAKLGGKPLTRYGDQARNSSQAGYQWRDVRDLYSEDRVAAAAAQQQRQIAAERAADRAARAARSEENWRSFFFKVKIALLFALCFWIYLKRHNILRWYYSLIPHPVRGQVDAAIHAGAPIDGGLYQELIGSTYGGPIENEVRGQQARDLTARLRRHEAALRSEEEQRVRAARLEAERDAAFMRAHLELLRAGVDHEDAAARLDELKRMTRR